VIVRGPLADGQGPINQVSGPGSAVVSRGEKTHAVTVSANAWFERLEKSRIAPALSLQTI